MRYFFDTEFNEHAEGGIELISIGIAAEDNRCFYAISSEFTPPIHDPWLMENVISQLAPTDARETLSQIRYHLHRWMEKDENPVFYGYFSAYDWVVLCRLFGGMLNLPSNWPKYCYDLKQISMLLGDIRFPAQTKDKHNALQDALWIRDSFIYLDDKDRSFIELP